MCVAFRMERMQLAFDGVAFGRSVVGDVCLLEWWFGRVQGVLGVGLADRRIDRSSQAALPEVSVMAGPQTSGESFQKEIVWMGSLHHADPA